MFSSGFALFLSAFLIAEAHASISSLPALENEIDSEESSLDGLGTESSRKYL